METSFQVGLWRLLEKQAALYTMGESTSLPEHDARRLLSSACHVLGINPDDPDPARMKSIVFGGVEAAFREGVRRAEEAAAETTRLWRDVCVSMPLLESVALKDTLESLRDFNARYEPRFFAHEIPADIDYPLSDPVPDTVLGADYVATYLERLLMECRFLRLFDAATCKGLLHAIHPQYGELILNVFEPVAVNAVGCALAGCDVRELRVEVGDRSRIARELEGRSESKVASAMVSAAFAACDILHVHDVAMRDYVALASRNAACRVVVGLRGGGLAGVFLDW